VLAEKTVRRQGKEWEVIADVRHLNAIKLLHDFVVPNGYVMDLKGALAGVKQNCALSRRIVCFLCLQHLRELSGEAAKAVPLNVMC
jgi:hypothetical protein